MKNCELHALEHKRSRNVHGHDCVGSGFYTGLIDSSGKEGCWTPGDYPPVKAPDLSVRHFSVD